MTKFEEWFLRRVFRREVRQGYDHDKRITTLYAMIRKAAENEFTEDNAPTLSDFLAECFERTQLWPFGKPERTNWPEFIAPCKCTLEQRRHCDYCAGFGKSDAVAAPQEDKQ